MLLNAEPGIEVIGQAVDGLDAVAQAAELAPDVVLMDVRMPRLGGIEATRQLTEPSGATVKVLVLTTFDLDEYVYEALRAGASGFLLKDASAAELAQAVRVVAAGDALLAPNITKRLIAEFSRVTSSPRTPLKDRVGDLTERETEVLALIAQGLSGPGAASASGTPRPSAVRRSGTHLGSDVGRRGERDRGERQGTASPPHRFRSVPASAGGSNAPHPPPARRGRHRTDRKSVV